MCSRNRFVNVNDSWSQKTNINPTSWDPYPQWQTAFAYENFVQDNRCCDSTNFNMLGTAWTPDKTNYVPDMNRNMALSLQPFKK